MRKMYAWDKRDGGQWVPDWDKARARFNEDTTVENGVVRWKSNGQIPPEDCREMWKELGLDFDPEATEAAYQKELDDFLAAYRANPPALSEEQKMELRAAHGPGVEIVDVISGRSFWT